jgi:hypothetical protein
MAVMNIFRGIATSTPSVVGGYVFYVDAANPSSYPGTGIIWTDLSGNSNTVTLHNSPTFDAVDGDGSLVFNGTNQYGQFVYSADFNFSGGCTYEMWIKVTNYSSGLIAWSKDTSGLNFDWCVYFPSATQLANYSNGTSTNVTVTVSPSLSTTTWYYVAITVDGSNLNTLYVNAVSQGSGTQSISNADITAGTLGGAGWNAPNSFMAGKIGVARAYLTALTSAQITQNFNAQKSRYGY